MELGWRKEKVLDLVRKAYRGEVVLPDFQRSFVWSRNDIEELIVSILEKMFIGTFLVQQVDPTNVHFNVIPIEGVTMVNNEFSPNPNMIILDGQQRITSIFYALYEPDIPLKNTSNPYVFFIKLDALAEGNVEEAVFSWSKEWREYRALMGDGDYDIDKLVHRKIIPVSFLKSERSFSKYWYKHFEHVFDEKTAEKIYSYLSNLMDYHVHLLTISISEKPDKIAVLFERINRTGVKLSVFDLLTARLYKFINLRRLWEQAYENGYHIRKFAGEDVKNTKVPYYIVQGIALSHDLNLKARELVKIDSDIINEDSWVIAVDLLEEKILKRLFDSNYGIPDRKWFSYPAMITVFLGLFLKDRKGELNIDISKIDKWYWSAIFSERYSSSTDSRLTKDFKDLVEWLKDNKRLPETVLRFWNEFPLVKISTKSAGSSKYKGVFNLLFRKGAWDFYEKDTISFSQGDLDDHHIFPKKFLERKGIKEEVDSVLNRTLILSSTNRHISSKSPASYIQEMIKIHGSKEAVRLILDKHFINGEMLEILQSVDDDTPASIVEERFREFIHMREELIKKEIKTLVM